MARRDFLQGAASPEAGLAEAVAPAPTPAAQGVTAPPLLSAATLLQLQRSAGNHAVSGILARQAPPGGAAPATAPAGAASVVTTFLSDLWAKDPASAVRLGLEGLRIIPGIGLPAGLVADVIGAGQDLSAIPTGNLALTGVVGVTVALRSATNIAGNGLGQFMTVTQLIEAFTVGLMGAQTGSGAGAPAAVAEIPFLAFLVALNEALTGAKLTLTTCTGMLDFAVFLEAAASTLIGPPADSAEWVGLMQGYLANQVGTLLAFANECLGGISLGMSQSGLIGAALESIEFLIKLFVKNTPAFRDLIMGIWNVLGGQAIGGIELPTREDLFPPPEGLTPTDPLSPPPTVSFGAGEISGCLADLDAMRDGVAQGDAVLGPMADQVAELIAAATEKADEATGSRDAFIRVREAMAGVVADFDGRLALVRDVETQAGAGLEQVTEVNDGLEAAIAAIEGLALPAIELPAPTDLGEGAVLDAIEAGVDAGLGMGADAMQAAVDEIAATLEAAKEATLVPLRELQAGFEPVRAAIEEVVEAARLVAGQLEGAVVEIGALMAQADSLPELLQALIDHCLAAAGVEDGATLDDVRAGWLELGPMIDEASVAARGRLAGASPPEQ